MSDPSLPLEERLRLLEAHVLVQEDILAAIQSEQIEAERLSESVNRLGVGASDLGTALLQVDKNQQLLTKLGQDLTRVESASITRVDATVLAEDKMHEARLERIRSVRRTAGIVATTVALLFGLVFYVSNSAHEGCELRKEATVANIKVLESFLDLGPDSRIISGIETLRGTLDTPCDEQYRLHL